MCYDRGMRRAEPNIEEQLRQAILTAGVSRYALSKASGVSQGVLSRFVHGERTVTMDTAARIAAALRLELTPVKSQRKGR